MKVPKEKTDKLDDKSMKVVYLRTEPGSKTHHLYDPLSGRLNVSRDVVFEENKG